jgi:MFS family permease
MGGLLGRFVLVRAFRELRSEFDRVIFVLAFGDLVASFGFSLVFPFLTIYLTSVLGASAAEAGLVIGLYSVASIASNAVGGWLADRIGRRAVMIGSISATTVVIAAMGLVTDLRGIGALTLLLGLVDPAFVPAARAAVADVVPPERRPRAYGLLGVAAAVGWIAGPSVGAGLSVFGYGTLFLAAASVLAVYTVFLVAALTETRPRAPRDSIRAVREVATPFETVANVAVASVPLDHAGRAGDTRADGIPDEPGAGGGKRDGPPGAGPRTADPRLLLVAFLPLGVVIHAASFQWVTVLPIHASRDMGVSAATWGLLFALNGIGIVLFQMRISAATERRRMPRVMAFGIAAYGLGYAVVAAVPGRDAGVAVLASVVILATLGEMLVFPIEPSFVSLLSPISQRGRYQGIFGAAAGLGSAIGPPLGGILLDRLPGAPVWVVTAGACFVAALGLWWLGRWTPVPRMAAPGDTAIAVAA